jgi:hypothetical protein
MQTNTCLLIEPYPEVRSMTPHSVTYEAFDSMVNAAIWTKNNLQFKAE